LFGASQFILIGISYASINFTNTYINLTGPVTLGLAYFTVARLYAFATSKALEQNTVRAAQQRVGELHGVLMLINLEKHADVLNDGVREKIRLGIEKTGSRTKSVEILKGDQKGLWDLFENMLAISWLRAADDDTARQNIERDIDAVKQAIVPLLQKHCATTADDVAWFIHAGTVAGGDAARDSWRALFAESMLNWNKTKKENS
ncbi:MAG TPA: molecular chaperone TorD, partial [Gallionella sp.]|nr:molecular chaperone TorD [Gallionella sp.]